MEVGFGLSAGVKPVAGPVVQIDEGRIQAHLDEVVRSTVEETLNALLDAEADRLCGARRYERTEGRKDTRAGSYDRHLQTKAGEVTLTMPKLRTLPFETAIIDRYRQRESSVEEALIEMYLAGVSVLRVEDITQGLASQKYKFEGKERDPESASTAQPQGLDYFGARFDSSATGRFMSPDWANKPEPVPYAKLGNPQTLNLYAFAGNNPESSPDIDGHDSDPSEVDQFNQSFDAGMSSACSNGIFTACSSAKSSQNGSTTLNAYEQTAEDRHSSIINDDFDPEGVTRDSTEWTWSGGSGTRDDKDREYASLTVGLALSKKEGGPADPDVIQAVVQALYDNLSLYGMAPGQTLDRHYDDNGEIGLHGGNWNFNSDILAGMGFKLGRNGILPSVHIEGPGPNGDHFHVDTANGASLAGPIHWIWDVLLGSTVFHDDGIPR